MTSPSPIAHYEQETSMTSSTPDRTATNEATGADVITPSQLRSLIDADPLVRVLDVRSGGEFDGAHIPGSFNVPLPTLAEHARELAVLDHPVVLVCKSGSRADQARTKLKGAGKHRVHLLDGGLDGWIAAGGDVTHGNSSRWAMDRQVRLVAGSISLVGIVSSMFVPNAKWVSGAVAAGLTFSAVSNTCAMASVLGRLPYNKGRGCDIDHVLRRMGAGARSCRAAAIA
jgi:rhodanese-related sulfurtransferase